MDAVDAPSQEAPDIPVWQRWNDYGIGLLRKRGAGELRQAEAAFTGGADQAPAHGPLNLARVYLREGRLDDAVAALTEAAAVRCAALDGGLVHRPGQQAERLSRRGGRPISAA